jgi:hypothetical protein
MMRTEQGSPRDAWRAQASRQLPLGEEIFLDHVGFFVHDVEAGKRALARVGFSPTPVSVQSNPDPKGGEARLTGTGNVTAMLSEGYIEVLFKTADTPLAAELDAGMARYRGIHLAAFAVADAAGWHRRLAQLRFRVRPLVEMQRPVDTGGPKGVARFTIARLEPGEMPEGRIQVLTHHSEPLVWQPRWLSHRNGALALTGVVIAVADVEEAAQRFARFAGRTAQPCAWGRVIALDRGCVHLVNADGLRQMLPEIAIPCLPFMAACEIRVASLAVLRELLQETGVKSWKREDMVIAQFPPELGQGAWMFRE